MDSGLAASRRPGMTPIGEALEPHHLEILPNQQLAWTITIRYPIKIECGIGG
jgi:hypothetical protein